VGRAVLSSARAQCCNRVSGHEERRADTCTPVIGDSREVDFAGLLAA